MPVFVPRLNSSGDIVFALIISHIINMVELSCSGVFNPVCTSSGELLKNTCWDPTQEQLNQIFKSSLSDPTVQPEWKRTGILPRVLRFYHASDSLRGLLQTQTAKFLF